MTIDTPRTQADISQKLRGDLRRELPDTDALPFPNTNYVWMKVLAGALHLIDLRGAWLYRQIFASTAERRHLERQAYEYGLARKPAARAAGAIAGTGQAGRTYPAGLAFACEGSTYATLTAATADAGGNVTLTVRAQEAGQAGNRASGSVFQLLDIALEPTLGAEFTAGADGIGGGADREDDESLRARILDRKRRPPQGGAVSDYEQMARGVPGVTKAWAYSFANGPGTIGVWFLFEGRVNGIPEAADVALVQAAIDAKRLIRAQLFVSAPAPVGIPITIEGLETDSVAVRGAIERSLAHLFETRMRPGVAASPFLLSRSWIVEAIATATGESRHRLSVPSDDLLFTGGEIPVLGTVTYD